MKFLNRIFIRLSDCIKNMNNNNEYYFIIFIIFIKRDLNFTFI